MPQNNLKNLPSKKSGKKLRLGIWGLGRGLRSNDNGTCAQLGIDVVAGCDFNKHMQEAFLAQNPGAFVTSDADEFLAQDFDAVLLATGCPTHAPDAIRCLNAGKHVLSEITAFHTMAQGVALVEAVERTGLVYNMGENYCFSAANNLLAQKWRQGLFGELMYAEDEYLHDILKLAYTFVNAQPLTQGNTVHSWRSWYNLHHYCTHSLGPLMFITGLRPKRVVALPSSPKPPGYLMKEPGAGYGGAAPSLVTMSNGAVVRNLMGCTTGDTHTQRVWGTLGSSEHSRKHGKLRLRLGGSGESPQFEIREEKTDMAHWVLHHFVHQIRTGTKAPFDIYHAADCTVTGILAYRSQLENGKAYDIPDFRDPKQRAPWKNDHLQPPTYDAKSVFPKDNDYAISGQFSLTMRDLLDHARDYRAWRDWQTLEQHLDKPQRLIDVAQKLADSLPALRKTYATARKIADTYPNSDAARVLQEILTFGDEGIANTAAFASKLKNQLAALRKKYPLPVIQIEKATVSSLQPSPKDIRTLKPLPASAKLKPLPYWPDGKLLDIRPAHADKPGILFIKATIKAPAAMQGRLIFGADGPVKVWINGRAAACEPNATNPATPDKYTVAAAWEKGPNQILFAIDSAKGQAWGITARVDFT